MQPARATTETSADMSEPVQPSDSPKVVQGQSFPAFSPRFPWLTGDLQTLRNYFLQPLWDLSPWPETRLELDLSDGSGDRLQAKLHEPSGDRLRPLAVLVHGLTGCEDSSYLRRLTLTLLEAGYPVLRLNLRGAGPGRALAQGHYHAGRSADLRDALVQLLAQETACQSRGIILAGFSLGANMLLKFLGDDAESFPLIAAAAVSAPIDLKAAQLRIMAPRNRLYHHYLLQRMKAESTAPADLLAGLKSVYEFDDRVVAPANGFEGADDYYRKSAAKSYLGSIGVPTLVVHAEDDPWIPAEAYRAYDWAANPNLTLLLAPGGGHVGFHDRASPVPWHDRCILQFFEALVA